MMPSADFVSPDRFRKGPRAAAFGRAIRPESARPRNGSAAVSEASRSHTRVRYAMVAAHFSHREKKPRCAVLRFATALRRRLRVQARAAPG